MDEYNFKLSEKEAELLMNALQNQTNGVIAKMQTQYSEQTQPTPVQSNNEENIILEENDDWGL